MDDKTLCSVVPFLEVLSREFARRPVQRKEEYIYEDEDVDESSHVATTKQRKRPSDLASHASTVGTRSTISLESSSSSSPSSSLASSPAVSPASTPRSSPLPYLGEEPPAGTSHVQHQQHTTQENLPIPWAQSLPNVPPAAAAAGIVRAAAAVGRRGGAAGSPSISASSSTSSSVSPFLMRAWMTKGHREKAAEHILKYVRAVLAKKRRSRLHHSILHHERQYREEKEKGRQAILQYHHQLREEKEQALRPEEDSEQRKQFMATKTLQVNCKVIADHLKYSRWQEASKLKIDLVHTHLLSKARIQKQQEAELDQRKEVEARRLDWREPDLTQVGLAIARQLLIVRQEEIRQTQEVLTIMRRSGFAAAPKPRRIKENQVDGNDAFPPEFDGISSSSGQQNSTFLLLRPATKSLTTMNLTNHHRAGATAAAAAASSVPAAGNPRPSTTIRLPLTTTISNDPHRSGTSSSTVTGKSATTTSRSPTRASQHRRRSSGAAAADTATNYFDVDLQRCRNVLVLKCEGPLLDSGLSALGLCIGKRYCGQIHTLNLHSNRIGRVGMEGLVKGMVKGGIARLETLDLSSNELTGKAVRVLMQAIMKGGVLPQLKHLDLKRNYIGNTGACAIASGFFSERLRQMETVLLQHNQIGDQGAHALFLSLTTDPARYCPSLKVISIRHNALSLPGNRQLQPPPPCLQY